eukprot:TRINITY_DN4000_c1_g1_i1.p1 TRINITY_DN4000_c1_g1~~TRINITY_DN4000_c1_g1_i1.p1  ORF type:complete len:206 (+),score=45.07 TRINITY_DN4000_c1_g1_i1:65-619(+)
MKVKIIDRGPIDMRPRGIEDGSVKLFSAFNRNYEFMNVQKHAKRKSFVQARRGNQRQSLITGQPERKVMQVPELPDLDIAQKAKRRAVPVRLTSGHCDAVLPKEIYSPVGALQCLIGKTVPPMGKPVKGKGRREDETVQVHHTPDLPQTPLPPAGRWLVHSLSVTASSVVVSDPALSLPPVAPV